MTSNREPADPVDLETDVLAHYSERGKSDSDCDASKSGDTKTEAQCSLLTSAKTKRDLFRELITAEQKVLSQGRESRNNHRYAVVVQVLVTQ